MSFRMRFSPLLETFLKNSFENEDLAFFVGTLKNTHDPPPPSPPPPPTIFLHSKIYTYYKKGICLLQHKNFKKMFQKLSY